MNIHSGAACWICLDQEPDDEGKPLVRDCACRGNDAGYAHLSCIINYATKKCDEARKFTIGIAIEPWETCPNCLQNFKNDLAIHLSAAFVSYAKTTYGFPGSSLDDKMNIMTALNQHSESMKERAMDRGEMKDRDATKDIIHELLAMVDQAKVDHNIDDWVRMAPTSDEFQSYKSISRYEAHGYFSLGLLCADDQGEASGFYEKARDLFTSVGDINLARHVERMEQFESGDNPDVQLENKKKLYFHCIEKFGADSETTIQSGIAFATSLRMSYYSIDAERLATQLAATSLRVYGENHICTKKCVKKMNRVFKRRIILIKKRFLMMSGASPSSEYEDGVYVALRYENDGQNLIFAGPFQTYDDEEEGWNFFCIVSALVIPMPGCAITCHGLINASHLNGKLGEVRSEAKDGSKGYRLVVHFEDKSLKPVTIKPENLRIAFELPSV